MRCVFVNKEKAPPELRNGLELVKSSVSLDFNDAGLPEVSFVSGGNGVTVKAESGKITITYMEVNDAFRGLGLLNARRDGDLKNIDLNERRRMRKTWVMIDSSRNAVLNDRSVKDWMIFMALAGINGFMFYTEDTYKVPGEPFFGYMRGAYSEEEMRNFDDFAFSLGIEVIPCIQTLSHMQRILQYDVYAPIKDTSSVMLCGEDKTYEFIEKIIKAATKPFRSNRIHIGMDEALDLGRGNYFDLHGKVNCFEIMTKHLARVMDITRSLGLHPMMWSDMFFSTLSPTHKYHDVGIEITEDVRKRIPRDIDQVYWDYHHRDEDTYDNMISKHVEMGQTPIFAPAVQTWNRFWVAYDFTEQSMLTGLKSCLRNNVQEIIVTMWGDDGSECDNFSALPLLQLASDMIFSGELNMETTRTNLKGTLGVDYDEWALGQKIDQPPYFTADKGTCNISKSLLWEDPLQGLYQPQMDGNRLNGFYADLARKLEVLSEKPGNSRLCLPYYIAKVLAFKADLPTEILDLYRRGDRAALGKILDEIVPELVVRIQKLNRHHRILWHANYKPFGWEVIEHRYGGLLGAFEKLQFRLRSYLDGNIDRLEELDEPRIKLYDLKAEDNPLFHCHSRWISTGNIS